MKNIISIVLLLASFYSHSQQFKKELIGSTPADGVKDILSADINGDGFKDIVANRNFGRITWYKNLGDETFKQEKDVAKFDFFAQDISAIDFDQDGDVDILSVNNNYYTDTGRAYLHRNIGNGEFASPEFIGSSNEYFRNIYSFDANNDGNKDIIILTGTPYNNGSIIYFENIGNGAIGSPVDLHGLTTVREISLIEDLNNDSLIDLIIKGSHGIYKLMNTGNMTFDSTTIFNNSNLSSSSYFIECSDINLDGKTDILMGYTNIVNSTTSISWMENIGNSNFNPIVAMNTTGMSINNHQIAAEDIDNDGDIDIICHRTHSSNDRIQWFENDGSLNFILNEIITDIPCSNCGDLFFLNDDFNNDGNTDIVIADPNFSKIDISYSNQSGVFGNRSEVAAQSQWMKTIFKSDLDNDLDDDLIAVNFNMTSWGGYSIIAWYENLQNGEFSGRKIIDRIGNISKIEIGDINSDGHIDILVAKPFMTFQEQLIYCKNLGNGNFDSGIQIATADAFDVFDIGDIDNDGDADIIYFDALDNYLFIQKNQGNLSFSQVQAGPPVSHISNIRMIDLDNDGYLDVVLGTSYGSVGWCQNTGTGTFNNRIEIVPNNLNDPSQFKLADMDSDSDLDVIYGIDSIFWTENIGSGNFQNSNLITPDFNPESKFDVSDLDGDGDVDIIFSNYSNGKLKWKENNGQGIFNFTHQITTNYISPLPSNYNKRNIVSFDLDGDSDQEVFVSIVDSLMVMKNNHFSPNQISGKIFFDDNQNGILDNNDYAIQQIEISTDNGQAITYSDNNGNYFLNLENLGYGNHDISPVLSNNWQVTNFPQVYSANYNSNFLSLNNVDFGIHPSIPLDSVETNLSGAFPRCNDTINYWLSIKNVGSTISSGIMHLELNNNISFESADLTPDSIVGNNLYWNFNSLNYFQIQTIKLQVIMPDFNSIGDTLKSTLNSDAYDQQGNLVYHAESEIEQIVVCAYDPNDKNSFPAKFDPLGYIPATQDYLDYTIRFQNTGNDTAKVVVIKDQLDPNLIWNSISSISSSHVMDYNVEMDGLISFTFNDINLPDSNVNFNASQGFVKFKIGVKPNLYAETKIRNYGQIYFDQNPAILTNIRINTIDSIHTITPANISINEIDEISIYPNPFNNSTTVDFGKNSNGRHHLTIYDLSGRQIFTKENIIEGRFTIHENDISKGLFIVAIQNEKYEFVSLKRIICR